MGADAGQIDALDLSLFGNVRVDYFDDGEHIIVSGFRLEQFKTHFETLGLKRCANGWMADIDQDDPDKIKDNLMDLCDHKKEEFVIRNTALTRCNATAAKKIDRIIGNYWNIICFCVLLFNILYKLSSVSLYFYCIRFLNNLCEFKYKNSFEFMPCCTQTFG